MAVSSSHGKKDLLHGPGQWPGLPRQILQFSGPFTGRAARRLGRYPSSSMVSGSSIIPLTATRNRTASLPSTIL
jgi:hypothetical protein